MRREAEAEAAADGGPESTMLLVDQGSSMGGAAMCADGEVEDQGSGAAAPGAAWAWSEDRLSCCSLPREAYASA